MPKVTFQRKKPTRATPKKCGSGKYSAVAKEYARLSEHFKSIPNHYDSRSKNVAYATKVHRFLSKGPAHVFKTFENDKTLLNVLLANGNEFFRAATRAPTIGLSGNVYMGPYDLQLSPNEFGVDDITKLIEFGFTYTPKMFRLIHDPSAALLRFACSLSNEEKLEIVYPKRGGGYGYDLYTLRASLRRLGLPTKGNKAQLQERFLHFLGAPKPVSLVKSVSCVVEDAKKYGVNLDANTLKNCGCARLHNWYQKQFKKKYRNAGAFAAKVIELILKDVCTLNLQPAKKKSSYEALEDVLSKKKDVTKHAFQQIIDAGFVGEEILFGAHEDFRHVTPECGVITKVTPTQITYRPYGKKEVTNESEIVKKWPIGTDLTLHRVLTGEGMIEKSVTVRKQYWDKNNLGQPKVFKKKYATKRRLSFKLRAKTNNKTKFSNGYKQYSLLRLPCEPDPRNDIRGGCWCYEYEVLSGTIKTKGGWVYDPNYESRFDYLKIK